MTRDMNKPTRKLKVRNLTLGEGIPAICVPVQGADQESLKVQVEALKAGPCQLVEWRADSFLELMSEEALIAELERLRESLLDLPIIFTVRTSREGGGPDVAVRDYLRLLERVAASGLADIIDIEYSLGDENLRDLSARVREAGAIPLISSHDFSATPDKLELVDRFRHMEDLGAGLPKIAVMPRTREDVLTLLSASLEYSALAAVPFISMSMGALGAVSRICGQVFGSCITFASALQASAPGQLTSREAAFIMEAISPDRISQ